MALLTASSEINGYESLLLIKGVYSQIIVLMWKLNIWFMLAALKSVVKLCSEP